MSQNGVALLMSRTENTTANLLNSVQVSTLLLSVILDSLCHLQHAKESAPFSRTVRAVLTNVLCILIGMYVAISMARICPNYRRFCWE
jgi:hypothetical protein